MHMLAHLDKEKQEQPRKEVMTFAKRMEAKLKENDHKGGWQEAPLWWLLARLKDETEELEIALGRVELSETQVAFEAAMQEAADVSNFCMFIHDIIDKRRKGEQSYEQ